MPESNKKNYNIPWRSIIQEKNSFCSQPGRVRRVAGLVDLVIFAALLEPLHVVLRDTASVVDAGNSGTRAESTADRVCLVKVDLPSVGWVGHVLNGLEAVQVGALTGVDGHHRGHSKESQSDKRAEHDDCW